MANVFSIAAKALGKTKTLEDIALGANAGYAVLGLGVIAVSVIAETIVKVRVSDIVKEKMTKQKSKDIPKAEVAEDNESIDSEESNED